MKKQEVEQIRALKSSVNSILHQILFITMIKRRGIDRWARHIARMGDMTHARKILFGKSEGMSRQPKRIILKWIIGFIWLLWMREWISGFHKGQFYGNKRLVAYQQGLSSRESVSFNWRIMTGSLFSHLQSSACRGPSAKRGFTAPAPTTPISAFLYRSKTAIKNLF